MSDRRELFQAALIDFTDMMAEIAGSSMEPETSNQITYADLEASDLLLPTDASPDVFQEIPRNDWSYRDLSTTLVPHPHIPNMFVLAYRSFDGGMGLQPCAKEPIIQRFFEPLQLDEAGGDHLFKAARIWSCDLQATANLPKDVRWVLAIIYDFSFEMLRKPERNEDGTWRMRSWLMHWYGVAERLFDEYNISAEVPDVNWFSRPSEEPMDDLSDSSSDGSYDGYSHSITSDTTMIHHTEGSASNHRKEENGQVAQFSSSAAVHEWLDSQPYPTGFDMHIVLDPTSYEHSSRFDSIAARSAAQEE